MTWGKCEVINMKTAEETHPSVKNTFNKYVEIEYIVLASGEENIYLINLRAKAMINFDHIQTAYQMGT